MQKIILSGLLTLIVVTLFGQSRDTITVCGTVKTTDGYPAPFITVGLDKTAYGATTDENGLFCFKAAAGHYTLKIFSIEAHTVEYPVIITADAANRFDNLTIIENKKMLHEVVVTGQFAPQSLRNSVYKVQVIGRDKIEQKGATNIQSLLNTEVGIRMSNDMALGETDFELMGMSGNNVKVLIDGVPVVDRLSTKQSLSQIDINTVERIEIIEGPMSVIYGSDALAGVINVITKKGSYQSKPLSLSAKIHEESVGKEYGFFTGQGMHTQTVSGNYRFKNGLHVGANFSRNEFGGLSNDSVGRKKRWQPKTQYLAGAQIGYSHKNLNVWYRFDYLNEDILTMANVNAITNRTSDKHFYVDRFTHQLQANWCINSKFSLASALSYQDYTRRTETIIIDLNSNTKWYSDESGSQDKVHFSSLFARVAGVWKIVDKLTLQPGVEFFSYQGNGDRVDGERRINNGALFLSLEYTPWKWLQLRPGVRSTYNSSFEAPAAIPSINVKVSPIGALDIRASYGRGYRAPTLQELYYSFHDSNHDIDGNPDLKAEFSNSYMLSIAWRAIHNKNLRFTTTLSGFYNDYNNRISLTSRLDNPSFYTYYNIDKYKTVGATWENSVVWQGLTARLNTSYIGRYNSYADSPDYDNDRQFLFSPEISANVTYKWKRVATFALFYKFTGDRYEYMDAGNGNLVLTGIEAFHWADLTVTRGFFKELLQVGIGVKNLFNVTDVRNSTVGSGAHATSVGMSQIGAGRSYFATIGVNFNR